jgi:hypothetical protein
MQGLDLEGGHLAVRVSDGNFLKRRQEEFIVRTRNAHQVYHPQLVSRPYARILPN